MLLRRIPTNILAMLMLLATSVNSLGAKDQANTNRYVEYGPNPYMALEHNRDLMGIDVSDQGQMTWHVFDKRTTNYVEAIKTVGPVLLSPADFSNVCWHVDHLLATVPPHFYGGGGGWCLMLISSNVIKWNAGAYDRDRSEAIKQFSMLLEDLSRHYIRVPLEQQMPSRRGSKIIFALKVIGVIGLAALLFGFCACKKLLRSKFPS